MVIYEIVGLFDARKQFQKVCEYKITKEVQKILQEGYINEVVLLLLKEILRLEYFWTHQRLSDAYQMKRMMPTPMAAEIGHYATRISCLNYNDYALFLIY